MTDTEFKQFLSDAMTAAGLVAHGKQSKALAERLGEGVMNLCATSPSVPDGWQLVPIEPTPEMLYAAFAADKEYSARMFGSMSAVVSVGAYDHYVAMLAAAPKPGEGA